MLTLKSILQNLGLSRPPEPVKVDNIEIYISSLESRPFAFRVWQELFNIYSREGGNLGHLYELLCDFKGLEQFADKYIAKGEPMILIWAFEDWGGTELDDEWVCGSNRWTIKWNQSNKYTVCIERDHEARRI